MIVPLAAVFVIFCVVVLTEFLWRLRDISTEVSRKLVHIFVASFVAFWPLIMSWHYIQLIGLAFLLIILISWRFNILKSIHSIERTTAGELFFAVSILILSAYIRAICG